MGTGNSSCFQRDGLLVVPVRHPQQLTRYCSKCCSCIYLDSHKTTTCACFYLPVLLQSDIDMLQRKEELACPNHDIMCESILAASIPPGKPPGTGIPRAFEKFVRMPGGNFCWQMPRP